MKRTISFATNRNPIVRQKRVVDFGPDFNARHDELRFGAASVELTAAEERRLKTAPDVRDFVAEERAPTIDAFDDDPARPGSGVLFDKLRALMKDEGRDTLISIHGYDNSFRDAVAASFAMQWYLRTHAVGRGLNVVSFTWPSDGKHTPFVAYRSDRIDAEHSGPAFGRVFLKLRDLLTDVTREDRCHGNVHLLCHSMGNWVLQNALAHVRSHVAGPLPRIFDQVVLVAADVDADALQVDAKLGRLDEVARRITVYCNHKDRALAVSDATKANPDRLGEDGPANSALIPDKVEVVDTSGVVEGLSQHGYQVQDRVLADIANTLAGRPGDHYDGSPRTWEERRRRWVLE